MQREAHAIHGHLDVLAPGDYLVVYRSLVLDEWLVHRFTHRLGKVIVEDGSSLTYTLQETVTVQDLLLQVYLGEDEDEGPFNDSGNSPHSEL